MLQKEGCNFIFKWGWQVASLLFFQSSNYGGCLIISLSICYHKWNDLPQFWNDFSLSHLSDILFYVRGLCRSISKKKVVGVQYDQTKLVLILHSFHTVTFVLFDIKCRKSMFSVWEHMKCPKILWFDTWSEFHRNIICG